jgi:hypothetical protein
MNSEPMNPADNRLAPGITEEQLSEAVRKSGYPLQTLIASSLRLDFAVQEEWSFLDNDTGALRTLDILADRALYEVHAEQPFVRPHLTLLIECKQADLPFVFFISATRPWTRNFPYFAGLAQDKIIVETDDDPSTYNETVLTALSLSDHPFVCNAAEPCMSLSKCVRSGKNIELSGTEAYQNIVLPLVKALRHFKKQEQPPSTARYFDCHIPLGIAILDAPMVAVRVQNNGSALSLTPWVRVVRHEAVEADHSQDRMQTFGLDIVHRSFFDKYLQQHAIPFAQQLAQLAIKHHIELSSGEGFVPGMGANWATNIEQRLRPKH